MVPRIHERRDGHVKTSVRQIGERFRLPEHLKRLPGDRDRFPARGLVDPPHVAALQEPAEKAFQPPGLDPRRLQRLLGPSAVRLVRNGRAHPLVAGGNAA